MIVHSIAVVGLGSISNRHRRNIRLLYPNAAIYAVSSSGNIPDVVDNADEVYKSIEDLPLDDLSFSIIASPATFHANHALKFIQNNIPVLIEKPLTASMEDACSLTKWVKDFETPVAVGYCLRYLSSTIEMKRLLQKGVVGKVYNVRTEIGQYLPYWRPTKNYKNTVSASKKLGGGALLELSHELDYLAWLFGDLDPIGAILRSSKELELDVEDSADILARAKDIVLSIHLDFLQKKAFRKNRIVGSAGVLEWDLIANTIVLITEAEEKTIFDGSNEDRNQMYLDMLKDFNHLISGSSNSCITVDEAYKTISFIHKVKKPSR